jgi:chaperone modulatory protein CbpM
MKKETVTLLAGEVLEEDVELSLAELCRVCQVPAERVLELVEEGVVEPLGRDRQAWRFRGVSVCRVHSALRLERDLGVNTAGAAIVLDLLDELEALRARLSRFER